MLEMRPDCERCGVDLPADNGGAFICSFECTFCADCADSLDERCPNCGGELLDRAHAGGCGAGEKSGVNHAQIQILSRHPRRKPGSHRRHGVQWRRRDTGIRRYDG